MLWMLCFIYVSLSIAQKNYKVLYATRWQYKQVLQDSYVTDDDQAETKSVGSWLVP